jgi:hypothetical protein
MYHGEGRLGRYTGPPNTPRQEGFLCASWALDMPLVPAILQSIKPSTRSRPPAQSPGASLADKPKHTVQDERTAQCYSWRSGKTSNRTCPAAAD